MATGPFAKMGFSDCEWRKLESDEIPLIRFVPTEPAGREFVSMSIYNSAGKKDSTFDVQVFDGTGDMEDLIRWWQR